MNAPDKYTGGKVADVSKMPQNHNLIMAIKLEIVFFKWSKTVCLLDITNDKLFVYNR